MIERVFASDRELDWLGELNQQQRGAAVAASDRPLLILAGAGSGKTATLSARVAWLIAQGRAPERILLLTFTRRAAREMLMRTRALLERAGIARGQVVGGTFHAIAWRLARLYAEPLGLPPRLSVLDAGDAADLLDLIREELGYAESGRRFPRKATLADIYSRTVNAQRPLSTVLAEQFPWCEPYGDEIGRIFSRYSRRKREAQALDLDDLLLYWRALATHEVAGVQLAKMFDHLLVDEYQDVNALQVEIVQALRRDNRGLTVVGDDLQAIYGFRAASAEHILGFPTLFPDTSTATLERNYRSTQPILDVANAVAAQAERSHPKQLQSARGDGRRPQLVFCRDEAEEATAVAERVLAEHERGLALREQAVLMRTAHHSDLLELELGRRRIPYVKYGGIRYSKRPTSKTSSPCCASSATRPIRSAGSASCNCSTASARESLAASSTHSNSTSPRYPSNGPASPRCPTACEAMAPRSSKRSPPPQPAERRAPRPSYSSRGSLPSSASATRTPRRACMTSRCWSTPRPMQPVSSSSPPSSPSTRRSRAPTSPAHPNWTRTTSS
jgi:DNA helicase II / ATP-dependent DNA helicase PcrA